MKNFYVVLICYYCIRFFNCYTSYTFPTAKIQGFSLMNDIVQYNIQLTESCSMCLNLGCQGNLPASLEFKKNSHVKQQREEQKYKVNIQQGYLSSFISDFMMSFPNDQYTVHKQIFIMYTLPFQRQFTIQTRKPNKDLM